MVNIQFLVLISVSDHVRLKTDIEDALLNRHLFCLLNHC